MVSLHEAIVLALAVVVSVTSQRTAAQAITGASAASAQARMGRDHAQAGPRSGHGLPGPGPAAVHRRTPWFRGSPPAQPRASPARRIASAPYRRRQGHWYATTMPGSACATSRPGTARPIPARPCRLTSSTVDQLRRRSGEVGGRGEVRRGDQGHAPFSTRRRRRATGQDSAPPAILAVPRRSRQPWATQP